MVMKNKRAILLLALLFSISISLAAEKSLVTLAESESTTAIVLIGGLNKNYHFLKEWETQLKDGDASVYGLDDDFRSISLKDSSWHLAVSLAALADKKKNHLVIIAHSLGGLVAKHALGRLNDFGLLTRFRKVELHAMGSPWGGSYTANIVPYLPFYRSVVELIGYPMILDIGSESDFMRSLFARLPSNVSFYLYEGTEDTVSKPETESTRERYEASATSATSRTVLRGMNHNGFKKPFPIFDS
jgi:pimeloyl-ACP methyl ester carboxylesterase